MSERPDPAGVIFRMALVFLLAVGAFAFGYWSKERDALVAAVVENIREFVGDLADPVGREKLALGPTFEHLQPARDDRDGVVTGADLADGRTVLLVGFFDGENQARLIRRDGSVVQKWHLDSTVHFPPGGPAGTCFWSEALEGDVHGAYLNPNGELVFNYEYCGTVKLDRCGKILWTQLDGGHHNVTKAVGGGYWVLGRGAWSPRRFPDRLLPFSASKSTVGFMEDVILKLDEDTGEVVFSESIPLMLYASGLEALVTANVHITSDDHPLFPEIVHSNKLEELTPEMAAAFPMFRAGDLLFSMRDSNVVGVIDRESMKVKWWKMGPWRRQHDPEFRTDGTISVFNNNVYPGTYDRYGQLRLDTGEFSDIMAVDPATGETRVVYGGTPAQGFLSVIRGQHEYLSNGDMMIADFDGGRAFEVDPSGRIVWDFVNRHDAEHIGEMTHAIPFDADYFTVPMGACD